MAILAASQTFSLPPGLLSAVCYVESHHKPRAVNRQDGGSPSLGLCQIKLDTAKLLGFQGKEKDLMNPKVNAYYAAKYLKKQLDRYDGYYYRAISAYNAGKFWMDLNGMARNNDYVEKVYLAWVYER